MFQECFVVLRSIVLHSLGIRSQTSPDSSQFTVIQNLSSQFGTHPDQISPQTQAKPSVEVVARQENESSSNKSHQAMKVSPCNKAGHIFMTPSPNSRISSGFGSLQDEEGSINCESSYDKKSSRPDKNSGSQYPNRDPNLIKIEQQSHEHERKRRRQEKHHRHRSHNAASAERDPNHTTISPRYDQNTDACVQKRDNNVSNPPLPRGAWDVPLTSPTANMDTQLRVQSVESSSDNQSFLSPPRKHTSDGIRSIPIRGDMEGRGIEKPLVQSPPQVKVLSPRAEKQRQKLHSKQVELLRSKEEKERLANEVNLLNLKVLEEGTK